MHDLIELAAVVASALYGVLLARRPPRRPTLRGYVTGEFAVGISVTDKVGASTYPTGLLFR